MIEVAWLSLRLVILSQLILPQCELASSELIPGMAISTVPLPL
jgi:hypothetical protein